VILASFFGLICGDDHPYITRYAYSYSLPLLVPACLLLDGPADLPQMPPEGV